MNEKITETQHTTNEIYRQKPKVAVYVCHCGGNISDVVDVQRVVKELEKYPNVAISRDYAFMCSSQGQSLIEDDIKKSGINRVVIAACMPALHELTFRNALIRAGLNPYLYEHVNIREQVSWVHKHDKEGATLKAITLIKAAVEKIIRQQPLDAIRINSIKSVCVIGGGISGMSSAIEAAESGLDVFLIEKEKQLGGKLNKLPYLYPNSQSGSDIVLELSQKIYSNPKIKVFTSAEVTFISGYIGNFQINVKKSDGSYEKIKVGTIIIASGFEHYLPHEGEYGYGLSKYVVRLPEFIDFIEKAQGDKLIYEGKEIKNIAFIHCVGSRQIDGIDKPQSDGKVNEYCSRVCCTSGLFSINKLKSKFPYINVFDIYVDIRTYSMYGEKIYEEASKNDVIFFRRPFEERPQIILDNDKITIKTKDILSWGEEVEIDIDMIVLLTGMMPSDISVIVDSLKLPKSTNRFLQEVHPKLRPVELANDGIFVAGTALGPADIVESVQSAKTASVKSVILLSKPDIPLDPYVAVVDEEKCTGCELCPKECSYEGALTMIEKNVNGKNKKVAHVNPALCKGCGACVAVCKPRAIDLSGWGLSQIEAMVDAIAKE